MPTITIDTPELPVPRRRAVAVRLTRWLSRHGVTPAHVVVRFVDTPPNSAFSGGMPLDALPQGDSQVRHASVVCCVGPERDERFREALADEVAQALGTTEQTPFLYVEFRPTPPAQVYLARAGRLTRADGAPVADRRDVTDHQREGER
ncbi:hypothetical protein [Streptomyces sp. PT12]|uniref:tautomerase family protein n=1 Tax=Streptomyces sp. PT12 TaxID=1510197 RepID=UPI000DE1CB27|nr:hypothetical protein [Streptomyces sp. PT12]RBM19448.1 hypothetical protein DEH69_10770 [Streptomyces sp. PT12]